MTSMMMGYGKWNAYAVGIFFIRLHRYVSINKYKFHRQSGKEKSMDDWFPGIHRGEIKLEAIKINKKKERTRKKKRVHRFLIIGYTSCTLSSNGKINKLWRKKGVDVEILFVRTLKSLANCFPNLTPANAILPDSVYVCISICQKLHRHRAVWVCARFSSTRL